MDIPDPKSGVLSGLLDYLTSKLEVRDVSLTEELPASVSQMLAWEETNGCSLPSDLKEFYRTNNGLTLTWKYLYNDVVHDIGRLNVNSIQELHLLGGQTQTDIFFSQEGSLISARQPSLNDLDTPLSSDRWSPSLSGRCKTFILDYCPSCGHVCLVYNLENDADCRYWLLDLSLCWHPLSTTFSDYLRLAVVHLALVQWPYALTILGLSPQWERWFRMFIPKRLEIDLELSALQTNSTSIAHTTLDTSKIVIVKPSKEKKSKVEIRPTQGVQGHNN
ncbi:tubulin polyglutamylase complex subunit 2-like isoform X2 [Halichondria panicea]|uniref:tubulin polyglutamylase complex subunit 2-like isoform X2 n=1 Tax=Halichondria panicea TaxID=6063 RepID=UPI00312BBB29